jgi:uncharacterized membrane protein
VLCAVGFFVSARMQSKSELARRGMLSERSVVTTPRAKLLGNVPNSVFGLLYYVCMAAYGFVAPSHVLHDVAIAAAAAAALMSVILGYSLLFVTRATCVNCWIAHAVNWCLLALVLMH